MVDYVGKKLGKYRLICLLGGGGFADVYLGEHAELHSQAAIKVLRTTLTSSEIDKFRKEARTLVNLRHPNIVRVLDFEVPMPVGTLPPFLVMDFAPNGTLTQFQGRAWPLSTILPSIKEIANALQYVHDQKLMHLDIKPENILLGNNNEALLSDFGIALAIQGVGAPSTKELLGTVAYMAPERLQRNPCPASDQYSLGIVVYELLSGACPFDGSTVEIIRQHLNDSPPPLHTRVPTISSAIEQVIYTALAKDPTQRFPTVREFATELEKAMLSSAQPAGSSQAAQQQPGVVSIPPTTPVGTPAATPVGLSGGTASSQTQRVVKPAASPGRTFLSEATLHVLKGHTREVYSVAWSPDSKRLASAAGDRTVRVWDVAIGDVDFIYHGHPKLVQIVTWAPDGAHLASMGADQVVKVWDAVAGDTLVTYSQHAVHGLGFTFALAWSSDSKYLASGSDNNKVHVWDTNTGTNVSIYYEHKSWISALDWSPDGQRIASGSNDKTMQVWDAFSGKHILTYDDHTAEVCAVSWSPDGKCVASAYRGKIKVWDAADKDKLLATFDHRGVNAIAWSPDSKYIASAGNDRTVEIWDVGTQQNVFTYTEHVAPVRTVAWSPDGKCLASGDEDNLIYLWKIK